MPEASRLFRRFPVRLPESPALAFWCKTERGTGYGNVPLMRVIWSEPTLATEYPQPTLAVAVEFRLVGPARRFRDVPADRLLDAAWRLYDAWPGGKGRNERGEICMEAPDAAVVATAFWAVVRGMAPPEAIRQAFADPLPALGTPRGGRSALLDGRVVLGSISVPEEARWVAGGGLGELWRSGRRLGGFPLDVLPDRYARPLRRPIVVLRSDVLTLHGRRWLLIAAAHARWDLRDAAEFGVAPIGLSLPGLDDALGSYLGSVAEAWPPERKVLLVPPSVLFNPGTVAGVFGLVAVEIEPGRSVEDTLAAIRSAAETVAERGGLRDRAEPPGSGRAGPAGSELG